MTDRQNKDSARDREGTAAERPDTGDTRKKESGRTGAGQEAAHGKAPEDHEREHQSNYGGGGANGGADQS